MYGKNRIRIMQKLLVLETLRISVNAINIGADYSGGWQSGFQNGFSNEHRTSNFITKFSKN